jgi:hypothetical protein
MIAFITNMQQASQVASPNPITVGELVNQWICDRGIDMDADAFLENFTVTNVTNGNGVNSLDEVLPEGSTLSVYTKAVATGGVKSACS